MGKIGAGELLLILGIVLLVFGPAKLPALAKSIGQAFSEFRKGAKGIAKELKISRSYVSRIEKRALTKILREFIKNKKTL